jgi:DNA/RNA endonuclease YhcR with UshA esterase domain
MKEKTLVWLAAACSVVGVIVLCLSSVAARPKQVELNSVSQEAGKMVEVYGTIGEVRFSGEHAFVKLYGEDENWVEVPLFSRVRLGLGEFEVGDKMRVRGKAGTYKNKPQVVPSIASDVRIYRTSPVSPEFLDRYLGRFVKVQGKVRKVHQIASGKSLLLELENSRMVKVFVPFVPQARLEEETVRACGLVKEYKGELEIVVTCEAGLKPVNA